MLGTVTSRSVVHAAPGPTDPASALAFVVMSIHRIVVELRQDVTDQLSLGAVYGKAVWDNAVTGVEEFDEMTSLSVNAFYKVTPALTVMAEYTQSTRTNMANVDTKADRIQAAVQFNF